MKATNYKDTTVSLPGFHNMIGKSKAIRNVFEIIQKVAFGDAAVFIFGESGVGKELVARSIHDFSERRNHSFVPINCGALPDSLFESELFGYEKGAFTGAFQSKPGLVELASGGTLFLDEICELSQTLQVKLLRMLEENKIRRIGGKAEIPVNVRIVTATNRDIERFLQSGKLREDLYFRINTIQLRVPPLRERRRDIPLLADFFLKQFETKYCRQINGIGAQALKTLQDYEWPGNVRELRNVIERTYYLATPPTICHNDLPMKIAKYHLENNRQKWDQLTYKEAKEMVLEKFEKEYLRHHLKKHKWNISRTANICDIDRRTIHRLINKFNLRANHTNGKNTGE